MSLFSRFAFGLLVFFSLGIAGYAAQYWLPDTMGSPGQLTNDFGPVMLAIHAAGGGLALILGPFQFLGGLRAKRPTLHRWTGRLYVAGCFFSGVAGLLLAIGTEAGLGPAFGFGLLAVVWLYTTWCGLRAAMRRDVARHKAWMLRTYALTFGAITLRLIMPALIIGGVDPETAYEIVAWAAWVPNLIIVEIWLAARRRRLVPAGVA